MSISRKPILGKFREMGVHLGNEYLFKCESPKMPKCQPSSLDV